MQAEETFHGEVVGEDAEVSASGALGHAVMHAHGLARWIGVLAQVSAIGGNVLIALAPGDDQAVRYVGEVLPLGHVFATVDVNDAVCVVTLEAKSDVSAGRRVDDRQQPDGSERLWGSERELVEAEAVEQLRLHSDTCSV